MTVEMATITGKHRKPNSNLRMLRVEITAVADGATVIDTDGAVVSGSYEATSQPNGTLTVQLPRVVDPPDARWSAVFTPIERPGKVRGVAPAPKPIIIDQDQLATDKRWDQLIDVSGVPVTASLLAQATAARDAAEAAADRAEASGALVWKTRAEFAAITPDPTTFYAVTES